ncbi:MAG: hypothetical protein H0W86_00945 [Armatimonadetes bacterium]|nr:hypothetical protein [Armatimonadota bacterium]
MVAGVGSVRSRSAALGGFAEALRLAAGDGQQVGHTNTFLVGPSHALLWSGTAESFVDLHPKGWGASYAMAASGGEAGGLAGAAHRRRRPVRDDVVGHVGELGELHDPKYMETVAWE